MDTVVSFEVLPINFSEEAESNLVEWKWTVTGEFPEEGITVNIATSGGDAVFAFTDQFAASPQAEFVDADIVGFDLETGDLNILLTAPEASFQLFFANDIIEEGTQTFNFNLLEGEGYIVDAEQNANEFTITDDNGGPGVGPTVSLSVSETELAEGDPLTVSFELDGDIPEEGVQVLVQGSVPGALGQFDLSDLSTLELVGINGLPEVGDAGGGSFLVTIAEPTASITTSIFNDIIAEEPLEVSFDLVNGEVYEVDPDASGATLTISDEEQPAGPTVSLTVDNTDVFEGDVITLTFDVEGEIPADGVTVLVNDVASAQSQLRSLTEFDVGNLELAGISGFPLPAEGDSGFFVTLAEPTATITLPIFDEGADEDEATEIFTFDLIDGEAYEVNPDAGSVTLNITDVGDTPVSELEPDSIEVLVTVENLSPEAGTFLTPLWVGFHNGEFDIYDRGEAATPGLESLAEDGSVALLSEEFLASGFGSVEGAIIGAEGLAGPIDPGEITSATFTIELNGDNSQFFSYASMVIPSNDAFIANGDPTVHNLFDEDGNFIGADFIVVGGDVLDAGTEINDELTENTAFFSQAAPNTGEDENGVVEEHPGFIEGGRILSEDGSTEGAPAAFTNADFTADDYQVVRITVAEVVPEETPVVSFSVEPDVVSEEDAEPIFSLNFEVDGEIPTPEFDDEGNLISGGLSVLLQVNDGEVFEQFGNDLSIEGLTFGEFSEINGTVFPPDSFIQEFILLENTANLTQDIFNDILEEEAASFSFELIEAEGRIESNYAINPDATEDSFSIEDGIGGPGFGPTVSLSVTETELSEGDEFTVNFDVDGEIPEGGLQVFIAGGPTDLGEFNIFNEDGSPAIELEGIDEFPLQGGDEGGFFVTLAENQASLTLSVFEDGPTEGLESLTFELGNGEQYEVNPDASTVILNIGDGGEDAAFAIESGVTSVFLDLELLEEAAGITLVATDSDAEPASEDFQVGFAIAEETDFSFAPVEFTPLGGTIEHSGTITLGLGGNDITVGEFSIGYDESRVTESASGFFVANGSDAPLGLEIVLFDVGNPGTVGVSGENFELGGADLLLAPELANALGLADVIGADVGDVQIDAIVTEVI
ncbi:MAG: spondin domain-containing protein [Cyanobacteria bacterium P01_F01_bin.143]